MCKPHGEQRTLEGFLGKSFNDFPSRAAGGGGTQDSEASSEASPFSSGLGGLWTAQATHRSRPWAESLWPELCITIL